MRFKPLKILKDYGGTRITLGRDYETGLYVVEKKVVSDSDFIIQLFNNEVEIYKKIKHRNIVKFLGEGDNPFSFFMEYAPYGTLRDFVNKHRDAKKIKIFLRQILDAISYLHNAGIAHNDITDTNFLVFDNYRCKLTDFAMAAPIGKPLFLNRPFGFNVGTSGFSRERNIQKSLIQNDIYSIGILFYVLLTGKSVKYSVDLDELDQKYRDVIRGCLSNEIDSVEMIKNLLQL